MTDKEQVQTESLCNEKCIPAFIDDNEHIIHCEKYDSKNCFDSDEMALRFYEF